MEIATGVIDVFYTTEVALMPGLTYAFKVMSRNSAGYSLLSEPVSILAAQLADAPDTPMTTTDMANIVVSWDRPYNGATTITSYTIAIRQSDEVTFTPDNHNCDGGTPTIVATRTCTIPVSTLRTDPYNIEWGASIWVKVSANNVIGQGPFSEEGNGAIMLTTPEPPINFVNVPTLTNA